MTYQQFLDELRQTPRDWEVWSGNSLRMGNEPNHSMKARISVQCPLAAICNTKSHGRTQSFPIDLPRSIKREIMSAADGTLDHNPIIRRQLLEACGLGVEEHAVATV